MLDKTKLAPVAKLAFQKQVREKVDWIAGECWTSNLKSTINDLGDIVVAGRELGVTDARGLSVEERAELVSDLKPLKILGMAEEIRDYLLGVLRDHGVEISIPDSLAHCK